MAALGTVAAICVVTAALAGSAAADVTRCAELDRIAVDHLRDALGRSDARSTLTAFTAMSELGWARLDCREGRVARGVAAYRQIIEALAAYEASLPRRVRDQASR